MATTKTVDLLTIGAGGGATAAAFRLARAGREVVMVDTKGVMSGNCLAEGCVPSKAVREMAVHLKRHQRFQQYGIHGPATADYGGIAAHKDHVQNARYAQHAKKLADAPRVALLKGRARIIDPHTVVVETDQGEDRYVARNIIVASGTEVVVPRIPGSEHCITSDDIYKLNSSLTTLPQSMVVVGGGYVGLETASFFAAFGTRITLLEGSQRLLPSMDKGLVGELAPLLDPAMKILLQVKVLAVEKSENTLRVRFRHEGMDKIIEAQQVLMAVGRHPVLPEGLSALGVEINPHGYLVAGESMQTNIPHIYSCGDVNGRVMLFHAAARQSLVAAHNILAGDVPLDYFDGTSVPTTVFTLPGAANVGLTRAAAAQRGIRILTGGYKFSDDSRAEIFGETEGGINLFFDPDTLRLLGGWVVGIDAGNLIGEIGMAVAGRLTGRDLARFADQHPMSSEGISRAARSLF